MTNDLASLGDEFDDPATLSDWSRVHEVEGWNADQLQVWDVDQTQAGRMTMVPHTVVWYQDRRGPLAFKNLSGDFVITSEVHISDRDDVGGSDDDDIPNDAAFSLGGLMLRTPRPIEDPAEDWVAGSMADDGTDIGENYVFLSLGHGNDGVQMSMEVKTTRNSDSQLELTPIDTSVITLQIARIGEAIITLYQLPGEDWVVHRRYERPDFPDELQAGMVTYTDWDKASDFDPFFHNSHTLAAGLVTDPTPQDPFNPDLVAGFEYTRFARPEVPASLEGIHLVNQASDQQLLSFLGAHANPEPDDPAPETLVRFELTTTDLDGENVSSLHAGDPFQLHVYAEDTRLLNLGVFAAYLDMNFNSDLARIDGPIVFGDDFPNARSAGVEQLGEIDEAGGTRDLGLGEGRVLLLTVPMQAMAPGSLVLEGSAADILPAHYVLLLGSTTPVPATAIEFGQATLSIVAASPVAHDDEFTQLNDGQTTVLDVLDNDQANHGASLMIHEVGPTSDGGSAVLLQNGDLQYTAALGFFGQETFDYTLIDSYGSTSQATVTVNVHKRWHHAARPLDVDRDQHVAPLDALHIVNVLNSLGSQLLPLVPQGPWVQLAMIDVNNDGHVAPGDVLSIFNFLNGQSGSGEGEREGEAEGESVEVRALQGGAGEGEWSAIWQDQDLLDATQPLASSFPELASIPARRLGPQPSDSNGYAVSAVAGWTRSADESPARPKLKLELEPELGPEPELDDFFARFDQEDRVVEDLAPLLPRLG